MELQFKNKVALITGASSGIGQAAALAFSREGAKVVVADILEKEGKETVSKISDSGGEAIFVKCDVSITADIQNMIKTVIDTYGRLDYAYNNAGIEGGEGFTADYSEKDWDSVLNINLKSIFSCMKYQIPELLKQGGGAIVNCSSVAGLVGFQGAVAYTASKHGIIGLTKAAALEYAKQHIRINAVCPGVIQTAMIERYTQGDKNIEKQLVAGEPIGRMGLPEEIAEAVIWLCSDKASFVTGHAMVVDGGWMAQ